MKIYFDPDKLKTEIIENHGIILSISTEPFHYAQNISDSYDCSSIVIEPNQKTESPQSLES